MTAEGYRTSFYGLTTGPKPDDASAVERIEIPLFQRDYAQGRGSETVRRIRNDFLDALFTAVAGDDTESIGLDFVYGGVDGGTLRPLDGQQRLTTLFLLHWYIASRSGNLAADHGWKRFSYATRQSARMFCESLADSALPSGMIPSVWITDQPWYLFLWRHDPTIQSMLVTLDAIHDRFQTVAADGVWARLTDAEKPSIWFLLLPLSGLGTAAGDAMRAEDLYIKMNSRGKPLTEFENFKAHFEKTIHWSPRSNEFALKVDTTWPDLFWHLRGDDDVTDDESLRYLEFITEICEWRDGRTDGAGQRLGPRTQATFGDSNPQRELHLDFLFQALDVWERHPIAETFDSLFLAAGGAGTDTTKVRLFFRGQSVLDGQSNLFEACCRSYGETSGRTRVFSLGQTLVLYAVLLHVIEDTDVFPARVRILRNLIEASTDELRPDRMPRILGDVHRVIRDGAVDGIEALNQAQANDEQHKGTFLTENPELRHVAFALEDHELLRGSLGAFELDPATFEVRASVFVNLMAQPDLWSDLLGALLAVGEYQRRRTKARSFLFGTNSKHHDSAWRELLTGPPRDALQPTRRVLAALVDRLVESNGVPRDDAMRVITNEFIASREAEARFDWRYYMVKYPSMRENGSSTYYAERFDGAEHATMGYSLCMLRAGGRALNGYYRDPYLSAIRHELEDPAVVEDKWYTGYESEPRRLPLTRSGASIRCVPAGFELSPPPLDTDTERFIDVLAAIGATGSNLVMVPQVEVDGQPVDTVDRVQIGADIVRRMVAAGL
jgi:hypothetical protein